MHPFAAFIVSLVLIRLSPVIGIGESSSSSHPARSEAAQRPEFMSAAHYQRTRQLQDEFRLAFACSPALPQGRAFDVDPPPPPPPRTSAPPQLLPSDRMSWLRRQQPEAHTLTDEDALLMPLLVSRSNCHQPRLVSSKISVLTARSSHSLVVFVDVGDCGVGATVEAVRRMVPHAALLLVYNAPPGSAKAEEEASAAATAAAAAAPPAATFGLPPPPPPMPVALYEKVDLARQLMSELRQENRSCTVSYTFRAAGPDGLINKTSVLFVSVSFILLMVISLSWLIFYYVQRFRYLHAKERLSRRLGNAAKKALTKIPVKVLKTGDKDFPWIGDQCAVCIEPYRCGESVRILPCRHFYHKSCIDPWLLDQRSCPLCKLDILKACGLHIHRGSHASLLDGHVSPEHSHAAAAGAVTGTAAATAAASAGTGHSSSLSVTNSASASASSAAAAAAATPASACVLLPGSVFLPAGPSTLRQAATGNGGTYDWHLASTAHGQVDGDGVGQVTIELPPVHRHDPSNRHLTNGLEFSGRLDASYSQQQQQQQQQPPPPTSEVCYPLVHRHHGSG